MATKSKIYIKPSKRGSLRKAMGAKKGQKLSVSAMRSRLKNASPAMRKKLQFALNARKWKHEEGGYLPEFGYGGPFDINPTQQYMSNVGAIGSGIAGIGTSLIDTFARPDELGQDFRQVDINEGARAGKSALKGAAAGAAAGSIVPGIGTLIGGAIGGIGGALSGWFGGKKEERELNKDMNEKLGAFQSSSRLSTMKQSPTYMPVAKFGGAIGSAGLTAYRGETHKGPTGGILVDEIGNPTGYSTNSNKPVALTENGEYSWFNKDLGKTYIFSKSLGFDRPVNGLVNRFKLNKPNSVYKYDLLTRTAVDKQLENLSTANDFAKEMGSNYKDSLAVLPQAGKGGYLSAAKAKEILRDGTAHKHPLTAKQKRYFGWIAGGRKEDGGFIKKNKHNIYPFLPIPEAPIGAYSHSAVYDPGGELPQRISGAGAEWNQEQSGMGRIDFPNIFIPAEINRSRMQRSAQPKLGWGTPSPGVRWDPFGGNTNNMNYGINFYRNENLTPTNQSSPSDQLTNLQGDMTTPLEIQKAYPIRKVSGTGTGVGTGFEKELPLNFPGNWRNIPRLGQTLTPEGNKLATINKITPNITSGEYPTPWLNPAGHILSAVGNLADYAAMKKAKPTNVRLPRVGSERIDLARQRLINERNAAAARATNVTNTRKLGTNAGSTFSNLAGANTGVNRLLGEQNMQSLMQQESTNAQMQQQANMMNAQMGAEEAIMNTEQMNAYRAAMARMNPLGNMARTAASYFADNSAYGQGYDTLQMLAPNAELYGPNNTFLDRFRRPQVRLRDKSLYTK